MRCICLLACLLTTSLFAQQTPKIMTKMVVQLQSPDVPADSFAAKPKTMIRAGTQFCRTEEEPDPEHRIHGLVIINEPDAWLVNLESKSAQHMVDPGPTFNCRMPVFAPSFPTCLPRRQNKSAHLSLVTNWSSSRAKAQHRIRAAFFKPKKQWLTSLTSATRR